MMLLLGDCLEVLKTLPENSVDALVTDPPYGWRFMGKAWDGADIEKTMRDHQNSTREGKALATGLYNYELSANQSFQEWTRQWATEAFRVLKPGAHALIFCGPRTYHRMASGVEDAGFEVRDQLQWLFGSGFPKSLDVSKAIDKAAGAEREMVGPSARHAGKTNPAGPVSDLARYSNAGNFVTAPSTDAAKQWAGWGTALKPANEPILLARKPLSEKTVAANVLKYGTGALNIDASRIGTTGARTNSNDKRTMYGGNSLLESKTHNAISTSHNYGRFPANLILDEVAGVMLDAQSGVSKSTGGLTKKFTSDNGVYGKFNDKLRANAGGLGDTGGASRFFYCAKVSASERGESTHPTMKPQKLMRYLCKLITPPGGTILDCFLGSGSTGLAAKSEGFGFIGIEREAEYFEIAKARINGSGTS